MTVSRKQEICVALINHGFVQLRMQQSSAASGSWWWLFRHRRRVFRYGFELANLLHRMGQTVTHPEFTEMDLSFINHAIPRFLANRYNHWDQRVLDLLVQFHDAVPDEMSNKVTWHPPDSLRDSVRESKRKAEELWGRFGEVMKSKIK